MKKEIWKDIPGYEKLYQASDLGKIRSFYNKGVKILHQYKNLNGYLTITLYKDNRQRTHLVHILILSSFNDKVNHEQVNHIDGNKHNNILNNLEWVTSSENHRHRIDILNKIGGYGSKLPQSKLKEKDILEIRNMLSKGLTCQNIAYKFSVARRTIQDIKINKTWKHVN